MILEAATEQKGLEKKMTGKVHMMWPRCRYKTSEWCNKKNT